MHDQTQAGVAFALHLQIFVGAWTMMDAQITDYVGQDRIFLVLPRLLFSLFFLSFSFFFLSSVPARKRSEILVRVPPGVGSCSVADDPDLVTRMHKQKQGVEK